MRRYAEREVPPSLSLLAFGSVQILRIGLTCLFRFFIAACELIFFLKRYGSRKARIIFF